MNEKIEKLRHAAISELLNTLNLSIDLLGKDNAKTCLETAIKEVFRNCIKQNKNHEIIRIKVACEKDERFMLLWESLGNSKKRLEELENEVRKEQCY